MATATRASCCMGGLVATPSLRARVCKLHQPSLSRLCPRHVDAVQRRLGRLLHQPRAESSVPLHAAAGHSKIPKKSQSVSQLTKRGLAGCVMGAVGAAVVVQGGFAYFLFIELFVYQATREYFGFVTAVDQKEGRPLPPPWAASLVTLSCMFLPLYCFLTGGKIAVALALSAFIMLSIFVTNTSNPRMATVSSAIFGLLYCGVPYPSAGARTTGHHTGMHSPHIISHPLVSSVLASELYHSSTYVVSLGITSPASQ